MFDSENVLFLTKSYEKLLKVTKSSKMLLKLTERYLEVSCIAATCPYPYERTNACGEHYFWGSNMLKKMLCFFWIAIIMFVFQIWNLKKRHRNSRFESSFECTVQPDFRFQIFQWVWFSECSARILTSLKLVLMSVRWLLEKRFGSWVLNLQFHLSARAAPFKTNSLITFVQLNVCFCGF